MNRLLVLGGRGWHHKLQGGGRLIGNLPSFPEPIKFPCPTALRSSASDVCVCCVAANTIECMGFWSRVVGLKHPDHRSTESHCSFELSLVASGTYDGKSNMHRG